MHLQASAEKVDHQKKSGIVLIRSFYSERQILPVLYQLPLGNWVPSAEVDMTRLLLTVRSSY